MDFLREYSELMALAREEWDPTLENGQVIIVKTHSGQYYRATIPHLSPSVREPAEEQLIQQLCQREDTAVHLCLCTMNGEQPEIPSWHLRSRLMEIHPENRNTQVFLWGGDEKVFVKAFSSLLPPKDKQ